MRFFRFLKPAPYREELTDAAVVKDTYRYWRFRTFYAMYIGYALYYFTRKSLVFAMPAMQQELGLGKFELGLLSSLLSLSYGASKFLSGILGDRCNPRYFMSIGLILTGIFNLCFGMTSLWWAFAIFWTLNGWFQGWGWPGCAKLLTHWYSQSERGRWWSLWNTSHNLGGAIIPIIVGFFAELLGWRFSMCIPGIICILGGLFLINRLRDTPQSLGLPPIERYRNDYEPTHRGNKVQLSVKELLFTYVLKNRYIWVLAFSYFFIYVIRTGINDWSIFYLIEKKGYSLTQAGFCVSWFEVGGVFGSLAAGGISDLIFQGKRNPVNVLFTVVILCLCLAFKALPVASIWVDSLFLFAFGFFIFGPQMLIGIAAAEMSHKNAVATATGFAGCFGYLGAAVAGGPLGAVAKISGWDTFLVVLAGCACISVLLLLPLWSMKNRPSEGIKERTSVP